MDTQRVGDIANYRVRIYVHNHDMGASGYVETPGSPINRQIIPASFAAYLDPFDYVVSRTSSMGIGYENQAAEKCRHEK
jgi:hypothetical protein